jgi:hypothetical protein
MPPCGLRMDQPERVGKGASQWRRYADRSEEEWAERAAAFLKHKLKDTETTYAELAKKLRKHGLKETEASIANKLARGTFPATFFLACIAALELEGVALEEI